VCLIDLRVSLSIVEEKEIKLTKNAIWFAFLSISIEEPLDINEALASKLCIFRWDDWRLVFGLFDNHDLRKGFGYERILDQSTG
jgi:hypothetical protein